MADKCDFLPPHHLSTVYMCDDFSCLRPRFHTGKHVFRDDKGMLFAWDFAPEVDSDYEVEDWEECVIEGGVEPEDYPDIKSD